MNRTPPRVMRAALAALALLASPVLADTTRESVSVDQDGVIHPPAARDAVSRASSAVVKVEVAEAKADILTNVVREATALMEDVNRTLTEHEDFAVVKIVATGLEDAKGETPSASEGGIDIVAVLPPDSTTDPDNVRVTMTWQYVAGTFSQPYATATMALGSDENPFSVVQWESDPVQIEWGDVFAYVGTALLPKSVYSQSAFLKVNGVPDAPVDDGQVFDTYSDGTDYTIRLRPNAQYDFHVVSGHIVGITLVP